MVGLRLQNNCETLKRYNLKLKVRMERFYQQYIDFAQFKHARKFMTGSSCEIEPTMDTMKEFNINDEDCDVDFLVYSTDKYAFNTSQSIPDWYKGEVYRINSQHTHKGYAMLIDDVTNQPLEHFKHELNEYGIMHGPARQHNNRQQELDEMKALNIPIDYSIIGSGLIDMVC